MVSLRTFCLDALVHCVLASDSKLQSLFSLLLLGYKVPPLLLHHLNCVRNLPGKIKTYIFAVIHKR